MAKRNHAINYTVEPQRRERFGDAGWKLCLPHQAQRFAIVQLTIWREHGKQYRRQRVVASFSGAGAEATASSTLQTLIAHNKPKPKNTRPGARFIDTGRKIIARSLTGEEYQRLQEEK